MNVYYNSEGFIMLELEGAALELTRAEAERLFVDLGYTLQDMDVTSEPSKGNSHE